ncbi:hypothetical protein TNCV_2305681 [Trichonephila clavipes]|nr:hypothetical protein TNCV_2305681 [Trichonephila clavipes]
MDLTWGILDKGNASSKGLQATTSDHGSRTCRDKQKTFEQKKQPGPFFQKEKSGNHTRHQTACGSCVDYQTFHCLGHPSTHPPALTTSQILLPDPPEQTTPQILLPDPPPELTTPQILLPDPPVVET